jgi:hypothetical protein
VLDVPTGATIVLDESGTGDNVISEPTTLRWARLADLRYAVLLGALERYLLADPDDRAFLRGWCFAEMFALRKLAEFLRAMPRSTAAAPQVAALPFTLPRWSTTGAEWSDLAAAFDESMTIAHGLRDEIAAGSPLRRLLVLLLASDERKLAESRARASGASERTRADDVRDVLDWAAGAGDPGHSGQGRFWNLQRDDLVQVKVFGANVTTIPGPGEDAPMVDMLRTRSMPQSRPKLDEDSPEFLVVEKWVADGCPDEKAQP